jgi:hypothetical protein
MAEASAQSAGFSRSPISLTDYPQHVRMPDGAVVQFPGDMPAEQIRSFIRSKFPKEAAEAEAAARAADGSSATPRIIQFEGRTIQVPADFTDDEVRPVLNTPPEESVPSLPNRTATSLTDVQPPDGRRISIQTDDPQAAVNAARKVWLNEGNKPTWDQGASSGATNNTAPSTVIVDLPDGQQVEVETNDPQVAAKAAHQYWLKSQNNSPQADQPGFRSQVGWQGAGRGLVDLATLPIDLTQAALRVGSEGVDLASSALGGPELNLYEPKYSAADIVADAFSRAGEALGVESIDPEEMTPRERLVYNVDRFATSAGAGGAGLALAGPRLAAAGPVIKQALSKLAKPYAKSARPLIGDVAGGAGMGAANATYDTYAPDALKDSMLGPIARVVFDMLGGLGGATAASVVEGAGRGVINAGKKAIGANQETSLPPNSVTGEPFSVTEADKAARLAQANASNPAVAAANIREATKELRPYGPDNSLPTAGLLSDDVGLMASENSFRSANPVPFTERQQATNTQARELLDRAAPTGSRGRHFTNEADDLQRSREASATQFRDDALRAQDIIERQRTAAGNNLRGYEGSLADRAKDIDRMVVEDTLLPMQEHSSRLYSAVDPERSAMVDATPLFEQAKAVRRTLGELNDPTKVIPKGLLARVEAAADGSRSLSEIAGVPSAPSMTSIGDLVAVQPEISMTIARAERAGNYTLANNLRTLRDGVNEIIETQASAGNEAAKRALLANENYRNTIGETFGRGPGDEGKKFRKDFNLDRFNRTTTPPSATAGRFLKIGQPEKAASLQRILDQSTTSPEARNTALREYFLADLAGSGVVDARAGVVRPDALRRWRDSWGEALNVAPGLRQEVDDMMRAAQSGEQLSGQLGDAVKLAETRLSDVQKNKGALGLMLGRSPENAVRSVLSSPDPERAMREIVSQLGTNQRARDGLKAAVRDHLVQYKTTAPSQRTTTGANPVSFDELDKLITQNERE